MRGRLPLLLAGVLLGSLTVTATAATPTCDGKRATIVGTKGDNVLKGTAGNDVIVALAGDDRLAGQGGNDVICAGPGDDGIAGGKGSNKLFGEGGRDELASGPNDDVFDGGKGIDMVDYDESSTGVTLDLGAGHASGPGTDTLSSIENVNGSRLDDSLTGSDRANYLVGELGNDTINAGAGEDVIQPGSYGELTPDDDTIDGGSEVDLFQFWDAGHAITIDFSEGIATGEGTDHFTGMEGMTDSPHDDTIHGSDGDEIFIAYEGNDTIDGRGGFDILAYWLSDNPVTVDLEAGTASGYGRDSIAGIEAAWGSNDRRNEMYGDAGNNILWGGEVDDKIYGRGGDDYIGGFIGDDLFDGGDGAFDIGTFCAPCTPAIRADMRTNKVTGPGDVTLVGIEAIEGSPSDDVIFGNDATNWIYGLTGDDKINGLGGDDFLAGDQGEDKADGGDGDDNCYSTENPLSCESVHGGGESLTCIPVLAVRACQNEGDPDAPPLHPLQLTETATEALQVKFKLNF